MLFFSHMRITATTKTTIFYDFGGTSASIATVFLWCFVFVVCVCPLQMNRKQFSRPARGRERERDKRMISLCRSFVVSVVWSEMLVLDAVVTDRVCECLFFLFLRSSILINNIPWIFCSDSICLCVYLNALSHSIC